MSLFTGPSTGQLALCLQAASQATDLSRCNALVQVHDICLFAFLSYKPEVLPIFSEKVEGETVSPQLFTLSYVQTQCYPLVPQLHLDFGDSTKSICLVIFLGPSRSRTSLKTGTRAE